MSVCFIYVIEGPDTKWALTKTSFFFLFFVFTYQLWRLFIFLSLQTSFIIIFLNLIHNVNKLSNNATHQ